MKPTRALRITLAAAALLGAAGSGGGATAQPATPPGIDTVAAPATTGKTDEKVAAATPTIQTALGRYGDPGGIRARLAKNGFTYDLTYIGEVFGNPSGGFKQGASYLGRLDVNLNADLGTLAGLDGLTAHAEFFQIHGRGLSANNTMDLFAVSGIEALPDSRIYEAWLEQSFHDGKVAVRAGQLGADTEFVISQTAAVFIGASYGWPGSFGNNLPGGGPVYPFGSAGLRVKAAVNDHLTLLAAIFDGDATGQYQPVVDNGLPRLNQTPGPLAFRLGDPPFLIGEAQYSYNQGKDPAGQPGVVKLGYLHHFDRFAATNQPFDPQAAYRGDDGLYGIIDQTIYREKANPQNGAAFFVRATYDPADRNLFNAYVDGGIVYNGLIPGRPADTIGLDVAYGHISPSVSRSDVVLGAAPLVRDFQATIEATYQVAVALGFTLQPDFQYIVHPAAHGIAIPGTNRPLHDIAVYGLRATLHY